MKKFLIPVLVLTVLYGSVAIASVLKDIKTDTDLGVSNHTCSPNVYVEPHEERCEWYYLCGEGSQTHLYQCADDLLYEIKMNGCNLNWLVDCGTRTRPFTCPSPNGNFPVSPNACDSKYYSCVDNIYTSQTCPNGEIFNPSTRTCSSTYVCPTTTTPAPFTCPAPNGEFPSPYTCTQYYTCIDNVPYVRDCPAGLYFNPATGQCDWPYNVPGCTGKKSAKS